ncbi:hypothetical protein QZH41_017020 [Actinostola sp. cb2023]|nr:hypothetical protein QZH41_017020 [Actinostola sp. cb2023]
MTSNSAYMTRLQTDLYKERHGFDPLSKTFQSSIEHAPGIVQHRISTFPERGLPIKQYYDLTQLKRSNLRWNDELLPRPPTADVQSSQINLPFPKESSLSSHMSKRAVFPRPEAYAGYDQCGRPNRPPSRIVNKAMGSFGRREIVLNQPPYYTSDAANVGFKMNVKPVTVTNPFFNRHDIISEFNKLHPSNTPTLRLPIQCLKKADWH